MAVALASGAASRSWPNGKRHKPTVQAVSSRGTEAVPQGRALPDRQVRRRATLVSSRRARTRPPEAERVSLAAAREAEGAPLLRSAREAVPRLLREGFAPARHHRREPARAAGVPSRQRDGASRLRGLPQAGAPADQARSLDG